MRRSFFSFSRSIASDFAHSDDIPESIDPVAIAKAVLRRRRFILVIAFLSIAVTIANLQITQPIYEANMVVAPTIPPSKAEERSLLGGSGLSNLLGGGSSPLEVSSFSIFTTLLTSTETAARLEQEHHLLAQLFADRWDPTTKTWRTQTGPVATLKSAVKNVLSMPSRNPGVRDLADVLSSTVTVADIGRTGLKRISVRYPDPQFALTLLRMISSEADAVVREQEQQRTRAYISFLEAQLNRVTLNEQRQALVQILATQERDQMLSSVGMPFSFKLVEQPRVLPDPVLPTPVRNVILAAVWGTLLGLLLVLIRLMLFWSYGRRAAAE
jgi:uncharacterized protein involved in exopolysaccharide biosynthesis